jgi:hypothetical protein
MQTLESVYFDEVRERALIARTSRKHRIKRVSWCTSPMDVIDRRRHPEYRASRVKVYHIDALKLQHA